MARIVRGQVLTLRKRQFVDASRSARGRGGRVLFATSAECAGGDHRIRHADHSVDHSLQSFLSYLGLGVQPPQASLGSLIAEGAAQINPIRTYWWMIAFPAGLLAITLLALNFVGDGLRDAWDPRTRVKFVLFCSLRLHVGRAME